ncbi:peptidyl-tRNA hydrolase [Plasmodiophora brassicae]
MDPTTLTTVSVGIGSVIAGFCLGRWSRGRWAAPPPSYRSMKFSRCQMVLLVRKDLRMDKGKQCAQCAHATLGAYRRAVKHFPDALWAWETFGQAKIALQVPDEEDMMALKAKADAAGLCTYVVHDAGRTQVAAGSATVLAIGPAPKDAVDQITGHLKLL